MEAYWPSTEYVPAENSHAIEGSCAGQYLSRSYGASRCICQATEQTEESLVNVIGLP